MWWQDWLWGFWNGLSAWVVLIALSSAVYLAAGWMLLLHPAAYLIAPPALLAVALLAAALPAWRAARISPLVRASLGL